MVRISEAVRRLKKLRGAVSQSEFAWEVGIPQSRLSQYERGNPPPIKARLKLGHFALKNGLFAEALWWFESVGLDVDLLNALADMGATANGFPASGGVVNVPPHPRIAPEKKHAGSPGFLRPLPDWMIEELGTTFYVEASDDFIVPFRHGDLILVDSSEVNQSNLLESFVVAYRPNNFSDEQRAKLERSWAEQLSPEQAKLRRDRRQFPFLRTGIFVGRLTLGGVFGGARGIEIRTKSGDTAFEVLRPDAHELLIAETDAERSAVGRMASKSASSRHAALKTKSVFARYTELQIIGRAIGWLSAPNKEKLEK